MVRDNRRPELRNKMINETENYLNRMLGYSPKVDVDAVMCRLESQRDLQAKPSNKNAKPE